MDIASLLDPEIAEALKSMPQMDGFTAGEIGPMREARNAQQATVKLSDAVERRDIQVPGRDGAPDVTLRIYRAKNATGSLPCVYSIHGGGYVFGTRANDDLRFDRWCPELNCVGVSVEYRLSPETAYPGPLEDCYAGLDWVYKNAASIGVDPNRIGISGASAGAGLAAGLALLARDRGELPIQFQLLIYPMIDDRLQNVSHKWQVPIWTPKSNDAGWRAYLGPLFGTKDIPAYAAPARATNLAGLPPTMIPVGSLDAFLDEDVEYAMRLTHAGVPTELRVYPGGPHGFDSLLPNTALARRARRDMEEWLSRHL